jgi:hypothetical protein
MFGFIKNVILEPFNTREEELNYPIDIKTVENIVLSIKEMYKTNNNSNNIIIYNTNEINNNMIIETMNIDVGKYIPIVQIVDLQNKNNNIDENQNYASYKKDIWNTTLNMCEIEIYYNNIQTPNLSNFKYPIINLLNERFYFTQYTFNNFYTQGSFKHSFNIYHYECIQNNVKIYIQF